MARIAIYVPDYRMSDIEHWREKLNYSQLFIEAFDRAIKSQEKLIKLKDSQMRALVQRLKQQTAKGFEFGWKTGAKEGTLWATKHAYESHLRRIAEGELRFDKSEDDVVNWLRWHYEPAGYMNTAEDEHDEICAERFTDEEAVRRGFNAGFVDAVKNIWDQIQSALINDEQVNR